VNAGDIDKFESLSRERQADIAAQVRACVLMIVCSVSVLRVRTY
jgi:hypothetical protein